MTLSWHVSAVLRPFVTGIGSLSLMWTAAAGGAESLSLWGNLDHGLGTPPPGLTNILALDAGYRHAIALVWPGRVMVWGRGLEGQTNVPPELSHPAGGVVAVGAGEFFSVALRDDGRVMAWGGDTFGETEVPPGLSNVTAIAAGAYHVLALKPDGRVVGWGRNGYGQASPPARATNVMAIAAGYEHSLALQSNGTVLAWGRNLYGQISVPAGLRDVVAIAAGNAHNFALQADGTLVGWGYNDSERATAPTGLSNVVSVAAGSYHNLALRPDSTVVSWGLDRFGETNVPPDLTDVVMIAGGHYSSLALIGSAAPFVTRHAVGGVVYAGLPMVFSASVRSASTVSWQWQFEEADILGATNETLVLPAVDVADQGRYRAVVRNEAGETVTLPARLIVLEQAPFVTSPPGSRISHQGGTTTFHVVADGSRPLSYQWHRDGMAIVGATNDTLRLEELTGESAGQYTVAVSNAFGGVISAPAFLELSPVVAWGYYYGQSPFPHGLSNVVGVAAGASHNLALMADGTVRAWGDNALGATAVPLSVTNAVAIAAGWGFSMALGADGRVTAWGTVRGASIEPPPALTDVVAIAAGNQHLLALTDKGTVISWGSETAVPQDVHQVVAIAAGGAHSLALKQDGTVHEWGTISLGQSNAPARAPDGLTEVVDIAAGANHSLALRRDGSVVAWGGPAYGVTNVPPELAAASSDAVAVAAGHNVSMVIRADGSLVAWGLNAYEVLDFPPGLHPVLDASGGRNHMLALLGDLDGFRVGIRSQEKGATVPVPTVRGRRYYLEARESAPNGAWRVLRVMPGDGSERNFIDPNSTTGQRFYRVWRR